ncbi:hypothetical protein OIU78_026813 [Salix suchowensis]|nr:hypothetical protein OIU78_026813 [Salix suchowensis]
MELIIIRQLQGTRISTITKTHPIICELFNKIHLLEIDNL